MYLSTPRKNKKRKYNTFIFIISNVESEKSASILSVFTNLMGVGSGRV
jgi:hypothetical protein